MAAKPIMIQGTMSSAGKSFIVAALCRIFKQDGYRVVPFKSQNMALNSYITDEGLEMGRAQVMQAEAAGVRPSVFMNPILLKPTDDTGSQVVVNGEVFGNMSAADYYKNKPSMLPYIMDAYQHLAEENDIIVIEGAGSPAEINLKENDIVNMGLAKKLKAPVIIVGDIDRGGVFAQLLGTMEWLDEDERALVKGVIINKFRGDTALLGNGIEMLENRISVPVAGVVPYTKVDIDDEDSLSERLLAKGAGGGIRIVVIKLPHISNFTDFNIFGSMQDVDLIYTDSAYELEDADMIIIPGTKNTVGDLLWLRKKGLEISIIKMVKKGIPVWGICGGYQMLGNSISDPYGSEQQGNVVGMGLLPLDTVFEKEKVRRRVGGRFCTVSGIFEDISGCSIDGYEMHMGKSTASDTITPLTEIADINDNKKYCDGMYRGNVYGSYVHGIFDDNVTSIRILNALRKKRGLHLVNGTAISRDDYKNEQYDILAKSVRSALDMDYIYSLVNG